MPEGWDANDLQARDALKGYMENLYDRPWVHANESDPMVTTPRPPSHTMRGRDSCEELNRLKEVRIYNSLDWIQDINKESRSTSSRLLGWILKGRQFEENWPTFESRRQRILRINLNPPRRVACGRTAG